MKVNDNLDQLLGDVFYDTFGCSFGTQSLKYHSEKNDDGYYLELPIPGLTKKDLSIKVIDSNLEIQSISDDHRWTPKFKKVFSLPKDIDTSNINAKVDTGVLHITLGINKESQKIINIL